MALHGDYDFAPPSAAERDEAATKVAQLNLLREAYAKQTRDFAEAVKAIDPNFIDRFEFATRTKSASHAEIIQGFCDSVGDDVSDLIDKSEIETLNRISEHGRYDD